MTTGKIAVVPIAVYDPFFLQVRRGVDAARTRIEANPPRRPSRGRRGGGGLGPGADFEVEWLEVPDASPDRQAAILRDLRARGVSGIVLCPVDEGLLREPIRECVEGGIPVATFCLDAPGSGRFFHIGQDLRQGGRLAGWLMGKFLGGRGTVGIITGFFSIEGQEERRKGFIEVLERDFPGVRVAWEAENHDHWEEAFQIAKERLPGMLEGISKESGGSSGGSVGLYVTAGGPFGAAMAVEEVTIQGKTRFGDGQSGGRRQVGGAVSVVCFDFVSETLHYIEKGVIDAAIGQNPFAQGYRSVTAVYDLLAFGRKPEREIERVSLNIAVRENVRYLDAR